eukprot:2291088-Amphidinium_carterae.1
MGKMKYDVLCDTVRTLITIFRMVAERAVHQTVRLHRRLHKVQRAAEQGQHCHYRVNSDWAAEVQIYMSLEDHNLANIMEDTKAMKQSIVDAHYTDCCLHQQGLGQEDEDDLKDKETERTTREHARDIAPILRRNTVKARRRRDEGEDGVPADEGVPAVLALPQDYEPFTANQGKHIEEFTEAFNHYSRDLQYILTKVTKGEVY